MLFVLFLVSCQDYTAIIIYKGLFFYYIVKIRYILINIRMNDFLVNVIYKNCQKTRFKNEMEDKRFKKNESCFKIKLQ